MRNLSQFLLVLCFSAAITACGGGGGGGSSESAGGSSNPGGGSSSPTPNNPTNPPTNPGGQTQNVQLSWTAPSTRADGTALSLADLSGYKIYVVVGSDASQDTVRTVSGGTTTTTQLTLAKPGNYTFAVTAVDLDGLESTLSNEIPLTLN